MNPRILTPPNATERVSSRSLKGKLFDLGNGQMQAAHMIGPVHVPDDIPAWEAGAAHNWLDPDLTLTDSGGVIRIATAWYDLEVPTAGNKFGYRFKNKRKAGGEVAIELAELGAGLPSLNLTPVIQNGLVTFVDLIGGLDIAIECRIGRILLHTKIKDASVPKRFAWDAAQDLAFQAKIKEDFVWGADNADDAPIRRNESLRRNRRREISVTRNAQELSRTATRRSLRIVDEWDGRTLHVNESSRVKTPRNEVVYPVVIDPDVTEPIAADAEDGSQTNSTTWATEKHYYYGDMHGSYAAYNQHPGWRFTSVAIPQAATINAASLTVDCGKILLSGSGWSCLVYGDDVDDSAAWATATRPSTRTKTTASYTVPSITTTGSKVWNGAGLIAVIQEIVNRAGWASGNNLGLFTEAAGAGGTERKVYFDDYGSTLNDEAVLFVTYTAGGGGTNPKGPLGNPFAGPFGGPI